MTAPRIDEKQHFLSETAGRREALRIQIDLAADRLAKRKSIAEAIGTDELSLVDRIEQLGFTGDSARVLDVLPLIHVAWADGRVQQAERATVLSIIEQRGIAPDSDACLLVESLLEQRPSETFLSESLAVLRDLSASVGRDASDVVALCADVAEASGGLLGFGSRVNVAEHALIRQVADVLGEAAQSKFRARLGG